MRLRTAEIDRYGPLYDCRPPCPDGISVISGPNEAGKTLYLEALLQLLEPDVADLMEPSPRVDQPPTGRVIVEHGGTQYECDGQTSLSDITPVEPAHLQSVFVVRDSDLQLPIDQDYYTSLIEKLGDIHTTEINRIKSKLIDRGRLTDTRHNISSDQDYDNAGDVRDAAETLARDVREYVAEIEREALDELDARRLRVKRKRKEIQAELDTLEEAGTVAEYERLSEQLETYRSASEERAALDGFDRETFDALRESRNDLKRDRETSQELDEKIETKELEVEETAEELAKFEARQSELERRSAAVEDARSELERYRDNQEEAAGADRQLSLTRPATLLAVLGAGGAGVAGAIAGSLLAVGLGVVLLLVSVVSGIRYYRANQRLTQVEQSRKTALQTARDAGFDVETVEEVAPAIESFESAVANVDSQVVKTEQQHENAENVLEALRQEKSQLESKIETAERELDERLAEAGVKSLEEYKQQLEAREALEPKRQTARQSLVDRFGEPAREDPAATARVLERKLEALVNDVDVQDVDAEAFDEAERDRLEAELERLEQELEELQDRLDDHDHQLEAFDNRARKLNTRPFIGHRLELDAQSKQGLEALVTDLDTVVEQIEADAELSRKALEIFSRIESKEEQKLTELFDPDGPASRTFRELTGGRYSEVAYNPDGHELVVTRRDGRTFGPETLSQGTNDQLYFATRVSLAQQLLGNTPGFLLLDDPFLAADPDRLQNGFQTLQDLADDGWQIVYLTAKQEVRDWMVTEYDLAQTKLEPETLQR